MSLVPLHTGLSMQAVQPLQCVGECQPETVQQRCRLVMLTSLEGGRCWRRAKWLCRPDAEILQYVLKGIWAPLPAHLGADLKPVEVNEKTPIDAQAPNLLNLEGRFRGWCSWGELEQCQCQKHWSCPNSVLHFIPKHFTDLPTYKGHVKCSHFWGETP